MKLKIFMCIIVMLGLSACEEDSAITTGGTCSILKTVSSESRTVVCIDYPSGDADTITADCVTFQATYSVAISSEGYEFQLGGNCTSTENVGTCSDTSHGGDVTYYSYEFNAGTAAVDCVGNHSGSFSL